MKTRNLLFSLLLLMLSSSVLAQKTKSEVNLLNKNGKKEGLWIDNGGGWPTETYYKDGLESGVYKQYLPNGKLSVIGEYHLGKMTGTWYSFEDTGHLLFTFNNFSENKNSIMVDGRKLTPECKCDFKIYHDNGNVKSEGSVLFFKDDAPESDTSINYGEWKYYDKEGKLINIKIFK